MIDTIALKLNCKEFKILDYSKFKQSSYTGQNNYIKAVYNIKLVGYTLCLTLYNYGSPELMIQFSAPKLLKGNNFDELDNNDFEPLIQKLTSDLRLASVEVYQYNLRNAMVSKIDYSKNIIFTDGTKSSMIIHELSKADISKKLDICETKYRNGNNLQFHANSYEYVFYDKIADLRQSKISEKRSFENDNIVQLNLLDQIKDEPFEVFRIEIRLANRTKLKSTLKQLGLIQQMTFESLFKQAISRQILLHFWANTTDCMNFMMIKDNDLSFILAKILGTGLFTASRALAMTASLKIIHSEGERKFEKIVGPHWHSKTYGSLKSDIIGIAEILPKNIKLKALQKVGKEIERFEKTQLKNYPQVN